VAEKDTKKKTAAKPTPAAKTTTAAKATAAKKPAAPAKRTVARPVTRVAKAPVAARPRATKEERDARPKREKVAPKALPTAAAGSAPLISADGSSSGSVALPDVIAHPARRSTVLFQALLASRANARQANAATKNRARVAGGGAKPWRQKGTGRARQGSTRSPLWRHGGVVFGPNGRRYEQRMPEKMRRAAFAEALSERAAAGRVLVFEELRLEGDRPRTRDAAKWLANIGDTGRTMLVSAVLDERVGRAVANLPHVELRTPGTLRLSDVLSADTLLVNRPALDALAARAAVRAASA
jgi:large subunit ribosomal protein L4